MKESQQLQHIISKSKWSMEDLNMLLRLSNGNYDRAISTILQHEKTGLPAELLIRSRRHGGAQDDYHFQPQQQKMISMATPCAISASASRRTRTNNQDSCQPSNCETTAIPSFAPPIHDVEKLNGWASYEMCNARRCVSSDQTGRRGVYTCSTTTDIPPVFQVESWSYEGGGRRRGHNSSSISLQEPGHPPRRRDRIFPDGTASTKPLHPHSCPEDLLRRLSPAEKDQLLCHFLSDQGCAYPGGQTRQEETRIPSNKTDSSAKELEIQNIQTGLFQSYLGKKEKDSIENIDDISMELGIEASNQEFRELCHRQVEERKTEKALIDMAKMASSLMCPPPLLAREESIIEEAKRCSLACPNFSDTREDGSLVSRYTPRQQEDHAIIEKAKRVSLAEPSPVSKEERLIEDVKRQSLKVRVEMDRGMRFNSRYYGYGDDGAASVQTAATFPFASDGTMAKNFRGDFEESSFSYRKPPPRDLMQAAAVARDDASTENLMAARSVPVPLDAERAAHSSYTSLLGHNHPPGDRNRTEFAAIPPTGYDALALAENLGVARRVQMADGVGAPYPFVPDRKQPPKYGTLAEFSTIPCNRYTSLVDDAVDDLYSIVSDRKQPPQDKRK